MCRYPASVRPSTFSNDISSIKIHEANYFHITHIAFTGRGGQNLCFLLRTLVAMATYSFHRLIMGKWKLTISAELLGIFEICFTEMFIE